MKNNVPSVWTEEKIEYLKRAWTNGTSRIEMERHLGIPRKKISGKAYRLCLGNRTSQVTNSKQAIYKTPGMPFIPPSRILTYVEHTRSYI